MKKLMILGGSRYILPVIEAAQKLGIYVITCDYLPNNIAHKFSNEYQNVSIIDKDAVLKKAQELEIDGIMSFACDPGVTTMAYVAEKMGLPCVGSYEAVCILQNKGKFREFLTKNGFNVPVAKEYTCFEHVQKDIHLFNWPVIVKPTDSAGSKGVTKVDDISKLKDAFDYAIKFSHGKQVIIEDFLKQEGFSSDSDCFAIDGKMVVYSFSSQRFDKNCDNPYTPSAYSWPSSISAKHKEELEKELQRLITLLGLKTSIFNVETRECVNGKAYIMEMSPRGGGNRLAEMVRIATGVDMITEYVKFCVGLPIDNIETKPFTCHLAEIILHSEKPGIFDSLWISDVIKGNVYEEDLWIEKGTKVGGFSGANEAIGTIVLKFESQERLSEVLENENKYIKVNLQ